MSDGTAGRAAPIARSGMVSTRGALVAEEFVARPPAGREFHRVPPRASRRRREQRQAAVGGVGPLPAGRRHRRRRRLRARPVQGRLGRAAARGRGAVVAARYHDEVELTTFCSGVGPCWAERRTTITAGDRVPRRICRGCGSSSSARAADRSRSSRLLRRSTARGAGPPGAAAACATAVPTRCRVRDRGRCATATSTCSTT